MVLIRFYGSRILWFYGSIVLSQLPACIHNSMEHGQITLEKRIDIVVLVT